MDGGRADGLGVDFDYPGDRSVGLCLRPALAIVSVNNESRRGEDTPPYQLGRTFKPPEPRRIHCPGLLPWFSTAAPWSWPGAKGRTKPGAKTSHARADLQIARRWA